MEHIKRFAFVFCHDEFKPIDECIVHAFVCAEACDADSAVDESPLFGGEQVRAWTKEADRMSSRSQQARESVGRDCQSADVRCILFREERNIHGKQIR